MRNRIPAILAGAYAALGALSIVPIFAGDGALSGIFAVLLGSPWVQLLSSALDAGGVSSTGTAKGVVLAVVGIALNAAILYFVARWVVATRTSAGR